MTKRIRFTGSRPVRGWLNAHPAVSASRLLDDEIRHQYSLPGRSGVRQSRLLCISDEAWEALKDLPKKPLHLEIDRLLRLAILRHKT